MFINNIVIPITGFEAQYLDFISLYGNDMQILWEQQWKEETIRGSSCIYGTIAQYILTFYLCIAIYKEVKRGNTTIEYLDTKFDITNSRIKLKCSNIDLDKVLTGVGTSPALTMFGLVWNSDFTELT
jgi:hypothetical protein